jgi:hypothetical protein
VLLAWPFFRNARWWSAFAPPLEMVRRANLAVLSSAGWLPEKVTLRNNARSR